MCRNKSIWVMFFYTFQNNDGVIGWGHEARRVKAVTPELIETIENEVGIKYRWGLITGWQRLDEEEETKQPASFSPDPPTNAPINLPIPP